MDALGTVLVMDRRTARPAAVATAATAAAAAISTTIAATGAARGSLAFQPRGGGGTVRWSGYRLPNDQSPYGSTGNFMQPAIDRQAAASVPQPIHQHGPDLIQADYEQLLGFACAYWGTHEQRRQAALEDEEAVQMISLLHLHRQRQQQEKHDSDEPQQKRGAFVRKSVFYPNAEQPPLHPPVLPGNAQSLPEAQLAQPDVRSGSSQIAHRGEQRWIVLESEPGDRIDALERLEAMGARGRTGGPPSVVASTVSHHTVHSKVDGPNFAPTPIPTPIPIANTPPPRQWPDPDSTTNARNPPIVSTSRTPRRRTSPLHPPNTAARTPRGVESIRPVAWTDLVRQRWPNFKANHATTSKNLLALASRFCQRHKLGGPTLITSATRLRPRGPWVVRAIPGLALQRKFLAEVEVRYGDKLDRVFGRRVSTDLEGYDTLRRRWVKCAVAMASPRVSAWLPSRSPHDRVVDRLFQNSKTAGGASRVIHTGPLQTATSAASAWAYRAESDVNDGARFKLLRWPQTDEVFGVVRYHPASLNEDNADDNEMDATGGHEHGGAEKTTSGPTRSRKAQETPSRRRGVGSSSVAQPPSASKATSATRSLQFSEPKPKSRKRRRLLSLRDLCPDAGSPLAGRWKGKKPLRDLDEEERAAFEMMSDGSSSESSSDSRSSDDDGGGGGGGH
ncbi:hypothetical protein DFJ73DRAFT_842047, partial [Zopfochytrium polystomum]